MAESKTNVMRILEQKKLSYTPHFYPHQEGVAVDGVTVAGLTGLPAERVFKTLVTRGSKKDCFVFVIPVAKELDLKAAAAAVHEKSVELLHMAELLPLTGYIRGGCSPVGMKKQFKTVFEESALLFEAIAVSGGKIGTQVEVEPRALAGLIRATFAPLTK